MNIRGRQSQRSMDGQRFCELNAQGGSIDKVTIGQGVALWVGGGLQGSDWEGDRNTEERMSMHAQRQQGGQASMGKCLCSQVLRKEERQALEGLAVR